MIRVLLVEDDIRLASALSEVLTSRMQFEVTHVTTGGDAMRAEPVDIVLLDLGLPDMNGLSVLSHLRDRYDMAGAGIIVLTARGQTADRISGLRAGADDYIVKPVSIAELTARIEAVARRSVQQQDSSLAVGEIVINLHSRQVTFRGQSVDLTAKEYDLLVVLARQAGWTVPRHQLIMRVWRNSWPSNERSLEVHISALRAKLGDSHLIVTVRGVGYRLAEPACTDG